MDSSWPSGGGGGAAAVAGPPTAPVAAAAGAGVLTVGSIATVAGTLLIFVVIAGGLVSLQYFFDVRDDENRGSRHGGQVPRRRGGGGGIRAARGVDPELLHSLPVTVYRAAAPGSRGKGEDGAVECAVCLAELEDGEAARFLPRCGHGFHAACVDTWLAAHTTCPLCRLTIAIAKLDASPAPTLALLPVPPEPANYAATATLLPASVLLGVSGHGAVAAATMASKDGDASASAGTTGVLVIEIPELAVPTPTPSGAAKSLGSARLRSSFRRLWSFGRQGAGPNSSCSDVEPQLPPSEAAAARAEHQGSAV